MAAGMSDSAYKGRRYRFLNKVERAAREAGYKVERVGTLVRVSTPVGELALSMSRGSMSNGETVLARHIQHVASGKASDSWSWCAGRIDASFWRALDQGRWNQDAVNEYFGGA